MLSGWNGSIRWLAGSLPAAAATYAILVYHRNLNRSGSSTDPLPTLGMPNGVSLFRSLLIAFLAGFIVLDVQERAVGPRWLPAILYTVSIICDYLDGFLARSLERRTMLGAKLDEEYDSFGVLVASAVIVAQKTVGPWFLAVGAARYLFVAGMWLRRRLGLSNEPLIGRVSSRIAAGFQMGFMSAALWPIIPQPYLRAGAYMFCLFFFTTFVKDWLYVTGRLSPEGAVAASIRSILYRRILPAIGLAMRPVLAVLIPVIIGRSPGVVGMGFAFLALLVVLGIAGRVAALASLVIYVFGLTGGAVTGFDLGVEVVLLLVLLAGAGPYSIWCPERRLFER